MEPGRGRGRDGVRYLPSLWGMEPDLSRCLYAVPRGEVTPTQSIVEAFRAKPMQPAQLGRIFSARGSGLGRTGVFFPYTTTPALQGSGLGGTGVFVPGTATPAPLGSRLGGTGVFIPRTATPAARGSGLGGTGVFIPLTATPAPSSMAGTSGHLETDDDGDRDLKETTPVP